MIYQAKIFRSFGRVKPRHRPRHCACGGELRWKQEREIGKCWACMLPTIKKQQAERRTR